MPYWEYTNQGEGGGNDDRSDSCGKFCKECLAAENGAFIAFPTFQLTIFDGVSDHAVCITCGLAIPIELIQLKNNSTKKLFQPVRKNPRLPAAKMA